MNHSTLSLRTGVLCILLYAFCPLTGTAQTSCDFTLDGRCNAEDINGLASAIALGQTRADIDEDGDADSDDMSFYLTNALNRLNGDFDLVSGVDFSDFLRLSNNYGQPGLWTDGDANADGVVQFPDFLILADNFGEREPGLESSVSVEVTEADGIYTYDYTIENSDLSPAGINVVFLDVVDGQGVVEGSLVGLGRYRLEAPDAWSGEYLENAGPIEEVTFLQADGLSCGLPGISPGATERFTIQSEFGPGERSMFAGHLVTNCDYFFTSTTLNVLAPTVPPGAAEAATVPEPSTTPFWLLLGVSLLVRPRRSTVSN